MVSEKIRELVGSSFARRYDDLETMLELSTAAVALVEESRKDLPAELVVSAWTQHGNALRLTGQFAEAERLLECAGELSISHLPTNIHLLGVQASLHRNTGRYESAERLLTSAITAQKSIGSPVGEARLYDMLGIVYLDADQPPQALRCFRTALDLLTATSPPDLFVSAAHNLFQTLITAGRLAAAAEALAVLEPTYRRLTSARNQAHAEWLRARLCRALALLPAARLAYQRAYTLLSTQPRSPQLAYLAQEMASLVTLPPLPLAQEPAR